MKTDDTPLHGSYFELAAAKHPDLKSPASGQRRRPRMRPRGGHFGALPVVLSGALAGVAWLVIALKPAENVSHLPPSGGLAVEARGLPTADPVRQESTAAEGAGPVDKGREASLAMERPGSPAPVAVEASRRVPDPPRRPAVAFRETKVPESTAGGGASDPVTNPPRLSAVAPRETKLPESTGTSAGDRPIAVPTQPEETPPAAPPEGRRRAEAPVNRIDDSRRPPEPPAIVPARKIFAPSPEYPVAARQAGEEGTVVVEVDVDAAGQVTGARVARGRSPLLDAAAVAALESWRFEPARRGGKAIASTYRVGIKFTLREDEETEPLGPFEVGGEVEPPRRLEAPLPAYPDAAWVHGITGDVLVRAVIDENGGVADVEVVKGLPYGMTEAAVEAIRRWKFTPAKRHGKPVAVYRNLSVRFEG